MREIIREVLIASDGEICAELYAKKKNIEKETGVIFEMQIKCLKIN